MKSHDDEWEEQHQKCKEWKAVARGRNTKTKRRWSKPYRDKTSAITEERLHPRECSFSDIRRSMEALAHNQIVNTVECGTHVKEREKANILPASRVDNASDEILKTAGLAREIWAIGWMLWQKKAMLFCVTLQLGGDNLATSKKNRKIRDRPIGRNVMRM